MWVWVAFSIVVTAAGHDVGAAAGHAVEDSEESTRHGILSSSMQDYLNQISQLEIRNPTIAIPGEWLTDAKKSFIFLPIRIPKALPLNEVKLLTDGRSVLVNVVERPVEAPEDEATKKFRLILESFKEQAKGDMKFLAGKLEEWDSEEDNMKVKELIRQSLSTFHLADHHGLPKSLTIPLDTLELGAVRQKIASSHFVKKTASASVKKEEQHQTMPRVANPHGGTATVRLRSTYLQQDSKTTESGYGDGSDGSFGTDEPNLITIPLNSQFLQTLVNDADYVMPLNDKDAFASEGDPHEDKAYIKESFSISLPYPTTVGRIFAVLQQSGQVVVCMPYEKGNKAKSSPFVRVPVFDMDGHKLIGQGATSADLAPETAEKKHETQSLTSMKTNQDKVPSKEPAKNVIAATAGQASARKLIPLGSF